MDCQSRSFIVEKLYVGAHPARGGDLWAELCALRAAGIGAVVSVCEAPLDPAAVAASGLLALHLRVADGDAPTAPQIDEALAFISRAHAGGLGVLIHCFAGIGRSATVACCHLVRLGMQPTDAIDWVRRARSPFCVESESQREAISSFAMRRGGR